MSLLSDFITAVVPGLIGLVATLLQYYIPKLSERKSQRIQILKLISVEYDVVRRYMTVVQRSRILYFIVLFIFYFALAIFGNITVIFKQYDKYIYLVTFIILGLISLFAILVKTYSRTNKTPKLQKSANNKSGNLVEKDKWYDLLNATFFLHWKSIRNVSIIIFLIFFTFFMLNVLAKGPNLISGSTLVSGFTIIMVLFMIRISYISTKRDLRKKYDVEFPRSNADGEMESELFKIVNDKPEICIEDSKGEICGRLKGIKFGIEIESDNGVYIIPFTEILRIRKPVESHIKEDHLQYS